MGMDLTQRACQQADQDIPQVQDIQVVDMDWILMVYLLAGQGSRRMLGIQVCYRRVDLPDLVLCHREVTGFEADHRDLVATFLELCIDRMRYLKAENKVFKSLQKRFEMR